MSIIGMISQYVTPAVLQQIAKMLGTQPGIAEKAMGAAIPAILSGIMGSTKSKSGAEAFKAALGNQKAGGLEGLGALLGGNSAAAASGGRAMLSAILGDTKMGALKSGVASYAGLPDSATGSLLGIAGTAIMGAFGKTAKDENLDSAQILQRLSSERDEISAVMPNDFAAKLGGAGLLDALSEKMDRVGAASTEKAAAARTTAASTNKTLNEGAARTSNAARTAAAHPTASRAGRPWWQWVVGVIVLLAILWYLAGMFNTPDPAPEVSAPAPAVTTPAPAPTAATPAPAPAANDTASLTVDGVDLGATVTDNLAKLTSTLGGITDAASAEAAVPDLTAVSTTMSDVQSKIGSLPEAASAQLRTMVGGALPALQTTVDQLLGNSALTGILKPVLDGLMATLTSLAA